MESLTFEEKILLDKDIIYSDLIHVNNDKEYNQNGTVKAYVSGLTHTITGKTEKVRNRDYDIYSKKFDEAVILLDLDYKMQKYNDALKNFKLDAINLYCKQDKQKFSRDTLFDIFLTKKGLSRKATTPSLKKIFKAKKPDRNAKKYNNLKWYYKFLIALADDRKKLDQELYESDLKKYNRIMKENNEIKIKNERLEKKYMDDLLEVEKIKEQVNKIINDYSEGEKNNKIVLDYYNQILNNYEIGGVFGRLDYEIDFSEDNILIINFTFPKENDFPYINEFKLKKTTKEIIFVETKAKERNIFINDVFYSLYFYIVNIIFKWDIDNSLENIVLNGFYSGLDKRTGKDFSVCIMTAKINQQEFNEINLNNINPKDTFKHFSGKGIPSISNIVKVDPIRFSNTEKFKLIDADNILSALSADTNLAAMDWKDFEILIKDVFELEFQEQDIEIRNTQLSNDGGIDVVAFSKNPYSGGIILLQAKRYTNLVSPEPVRALKGSMEEYKATRGILVTTSDFGGSSREFADSHNITLINGEQLISLFNKHNYNFHINLEQAKQHNLKF